VLHIHNAMEATGLEPFPVNKRLCSSLKSLSFPVWFPPETTTHVIWWNSQ